MALFRPHNTPRRCHRGPIKKFPVTENRPEKTEKTRSKTYYIRRFCVCEIAGENGDGPERNKPRSRRQTEKNIWNSHRYRRTETSTPRKKFRRTKLVVVVVMVFYCKNRQGKTITDRQNCDWGSKQVWKMSKDD